VKLPGGGARLSWDPVADLCHDAYNVYRSTATGMRPALPPGSWPVDPVFEDVTAADGDASDLNVTYDFVPGPGSAYYLVVDRGTDGSDGVVGHFGE